jgi:hypothetical protein
VIAAGIHATPGRLDALTHPIIVRRSKKSQCALEKCMTDISFATIAEACLGKIV